MGFLISASLTKSEPSDIKTSHLYMCFKRNKATSSALMFMLSVQKVECQQCKFCTLRQKMYHPFKQCLHHSLALPPTTDMKILGAISQVLRLLHYICYLPWQHRINAGRPYRRTVLKPTWNLAQHARSPPKTHRRGRSIAHSNQQTPQTSDPNRAKWQLDTTKMDPQQ